MYFENVDEIPLIDAFLEKYKEKIDEILEENETNNSKVAVFGFPSKSIYAHSVISQYDYFKCIIAFGGRLMGYNEKNCDTINLTTQERYAFIAHEIGHLYDTNTYNDIKDDWLRKEVNADLMACQIDLKDSLISGLRKLIDDQNPKEMKQIEQRIAFLLS